jgi:dTDP-glucose pyrophosphorylase
MINVSKYVLPGLFMKFADDSVRKGANVSGEYFITDPINDMVASGAQLRVVEAAGKYLDTGTVESWVEANQWLLANS